VAKNTEDPSSRSAGTPLAPPRIARALLTFIMDAADRAVLIGDLEEEFHLLSRHSPRKAQNWYWRQIMQSAPHLILKRLRSQNIQPLGLALAALLGSFLLIYYWDIWIARSAARTFAAATNASSYFYSRAVYLLVQMIGVAIGGGLIAFFTFRAETPFLKNIAYRLAPAGFIVFAPTILAMINPADNYPLSFRLLWLGLAIPSLIGGARGGVWLQSQRN
jgi:hypothetical protein